MEIYHSFWEGGKIEMNSLLYDMHKLSVISSLYSHGNINLITTKRGKEFLGDLPYTSIELFDEEIDSNYERIWALGKIFAYRQISKKRKPFLHIDYDVFLFKRLPEKLLRSEIIVQNVEDEKRILESYQLDIFEKFCHEKEIAKKLKLKYAYNTGIFGGVNSELILSFTESVMGLIGKNKEFFQGDYFTIKSAYSTLVEQYYLAVYLESNNISPTTLFSGYEFGTAGQLGYTHLMNEKSNPMISEIIRRKIKEIEVEILENNVYI